MDTKESIRNRYKEMNEKKKCNNNNSSNNNNQFNTLISSPISDKRYPSKNIIKYELKSFQKSQNIINREKSNKISSAEDKINKKEEANEKFIYHVTTPEKVNYNSITRLNNDIPSKKFRKRDRGNFEKKFNELKKKNNIQLSELEDLKEDDDTNVNFITFYLDTIKKNYNDILNEKLTLVFHMLPKEICRKFNINKISEKEKFYKLLAAFYKADLNSSKLNNIILNEFKYPDEFKLLHFTKVDNKLNRWKLYCNKALDFKKIDNEEYFYYTLSNCLLNNFKDSSRDINSLHSSVNSWYIILKKLEQRKNYILDERYLELFEYIILFILNAQENQNIAQIFNINLYDVFKKAILNEINPIKSLNSEQVRKAFSAKSLSIKINKKDIIINDGFGNYYIKDYNNYYINNEFIDYVSNNLYSSPLILKQFTKFNFLINPKYYFDGLLYNIIEKYVNSVLSRSSIYRCFNIKKGQFPELEEEIFTKKIHNYIRYLPYNSYNDTGRTLKPFALIIIDPSKQKSILKKIEKITKNRELFESLQKFVNIVTRKFIFEHEQHHLCNCLFFYFYTNKTNSINTPPKQIKQNKVIELDLKEYNKEDKSILKESGHIFETIAYGKIKKVFYLKQLLFIGNENNDKLEVDEYRKQFQKISQTKNNTESLFQQYNKNNILYNLVKKIYDLLKKEFGEDISIELEGLIVSQKETNNTNEEEEINSINDLGEKLIIEDDDHYNCHIRGEFYCDGKLFQGDEY